MANSPKARKYETLAAESHARADQIEAEDGAGDAAARYVRQTAEHYERVARQAQAQADARAIRKAVR